MRLLDEIEGRGILLLKDPEDLERYAHDVWPAFAKWPAEARKNAVPLGVARPGSTEEVAAVLTLARNAGVPVVTYGGGSGVTGGVVCEEAHLTLDTALLAESMEFAEEDMLLGVGAGARAGMVEAWLGARGYTLGHYPQSLHLASIGGLLATRSSGTFSGWYGNIEDRVVGVQAVLSSGEVVSIGPGPRSSEGPDLMELFIGSEGSLGIITRVWLKVAMAPETRRIRAYGVAGVRSGLRGIKRVVQAGLRPGVCRLYDEVETRRLAYSYGLSEEIQCLVLLGFDGPRAVVDAADTVASTMVEAEGGMDLGCSIGKTWLETRFDASWFWEGNQGDDKIADSVEIAVRWSSVEATYERIMARLKELTDRAWAHFSHAYGQGVAVYFVFQLRDESPASCLERYRAAWSAIMEGAAIVGAGLSHHHGIGLVRVPFLAETRPSAVALLGRIKDALDPDSILNPGKLAVGR